MQSKFSVEFLEEAVTFVESLDDKAKEKVLYNIWKASITRDKKLFKKLTDDIWEFRTLFGKVQYRLFAFWDKVNSQNTLVIATHGIIKKTGKTPASSISKAEELRKLYFERKGE